MTAMIKHATLGAEEETKMIDTLRRLLVRAYWTFWLLPRWRPAMLGDIADDGEYAERDDAEREQARAEALPAPRCPECEHPMQRYMRDYTYACMNLACGQGVKRDERGTRQECGCPSHDTGADCAAARAEHLGELAEERAMVQAQTPVVNVDVHEYLSRPCDDDCPEYVPKEEENA